MSGIFVTAHGSSWLIHVIVVLLLCAIVFGVLQLAPKQTHKHIIMGVTFIAGLYFALEFFLRIHPQPTAANPKGEGNFLTPSMDGVSNWLSIVSAFTVGLGVINLSTVHGKRLAKGGNNAFNSMIFFVSMIAMVAIGILQHTRPNSINKNLYDLLFTGALTTLDATMFSIIAFYIVSASYRAFRVKSTEATILLVTAIVVMMGQIAIGQQLTKGISRDIWPLPYLHFEVVRSWILSLANAAAVRAIGFGLGIGGLAVALRIWLGLERGSYFDSQS